MKTKCLELVGLLLQVQRVRGFLSVTEDILPGEKESFEELVQLGYVELCGRDGIEVTKEGKDALHSAALY